MADGYSEFTTTAGAVRAGACRLSRVHVTANITGTITIYDNASAASGPVLFATPANPQAGTVYDLGGLRARWGAWVVPGSAGKFLITFD
jgi:hypothetical protein